jgi:triacylglycerol lipase
MFELEPRTDPAATAPVAAEIPELRVAEIPASACRLWLRGRVVGKSQKGQGLPHMGHGLPTEPQPRERSWFPRLWSRAQPVENRSRTGRLATRISNREITSEVTLTPEGYFEACLNENLPPSRRGWRVARNTLTIGDAQADGCGVVFTVPEQARQAVVVVLPLASTSAGHFDALTTAENVTWTGKILHQLTAHRNGPCPVYYLGCAPLEADSRQQEIALAVAALGWPGGTVILMPANAGLEPLAHGLDRLRWLFAGTLSLAVVNLEPELTRSLAVRLAPQEDRSEVKLLLNPGDDATTAQTWEVSENFRSPGDAGETIRPAFAHRLTRHPLVFCHGMLGLSALRMQLPERLNYFHALDPFLRERGFRALYPDVPATGGVAERAAKLKEQILCWTDEPINLIAHSMGGLDCRHMITHLAMADRVRSLTTISTPHHGTYLADWFIRNYRHRFPLLFAMEALGVSMAGFRACLPAACAEFNARTPDAPGVRYFSYGAAVSQALVNPLFRRVWNILTAVEGPNDGMVSVASARWGEYLGTISADHCMQTPDAILKDPGQSFDTLGFYLTIAEDLARRGF